MTRTEFYKEFATNANITIKEAKRYAVIVGDIITSHMGDENGVKPFEGMTFLKSYKKTHNCRNPQTGEMMEIPGQWQPKARFGKTVKDAIQ